MEISTNKLSIREYIKCQKPDLDIVINDVTVKVHRQILIAASKVFEKMLTTGFIESGKDSITLSEVDPIVFGNLIKVLNGEDITFGSWDDLFEVLLLVQKFEITVIDIVTELQKLIIPTDSILNYIDYLGRLYPAGIPDEVVDVVASQLRGDFDLKLIEEKLRNRLETSKCYRHYGIGITRELVCKIEAIADESAHEPIKYYVLQSNNGMIKNIPLERIFKARSIAEVILKARDWIWRLGWTPDKIPKSKKITPVIASGSKINIAGTNHWPVFANAGIFATYGNTGPTGETGQVGPANYYTDPMSPGFRGPYDILYRTCQLLEPEDVDIIFEGPREMIPAKLLSLIGELCILEMDLE